MFTDKIPSEKRMLLCDAQTSGGMLLSVAQEYSGDILKFLKEKGVASACVIGRVTQKKEKSIYVEE